MSRIGKYPVAIPQGVQVAVEDQIIRVKGKNGELTTHFTGDVNVEVTDGEVRVQPANDSKRSRAMWGTVRANVANLVKGVNEGFTKILEIRGVGYRAAVKGPFLVLSLGFSHEVYFAIPEGVSASVEKQTVITLTGANKQLVGETAAKIRSLRKPEPYKGKGVRYSDEYVRSKEGKKK